MPRSRMIVTLITLPEEKEEFYDNNIAGGTECA
jgi:hypothetical protein